MHRELKTNGGMLPRVADNLQGCGRKSPAFAVKGVSRVFVLDKKGKPLMPCHPVRARKFLAQGRARVHQMSPFTIRLVDRSREDSDVQPVNVELDPGAKG